MDAIDRQAAIDALKRAEALTRAFGYHNVIETIRDLPSAQPERKKGRWQWIQYDANPEIGFFQCSVCNFMPASFNLAEKYLNYCPWCGADMRGET